MCDAEEITITISHLLEQTSELLQRQLVAVRLLELLEQPEDHAGELARLAGERGVGV